MSKNILFKTPFTLKLFYKKWLSTCVKKKVGLRPLLLKTNK